MIEVSASRLEQAEKLLSHIPGAAPKAVSRAINRAADTARTEMARKVRETYYVNYGDVLATVSIDRARAGQLSARITSRGHALSLIKFRVTPNRPQPRRRIPIVVRVKRGEGGPLRRAFVAQMRSGHLGVFERAGKARTPIDGLYGPPVPQMIGNPSVTAYVEEKALARLDDRLDHEISRMLEDSE